jgi:hypothetical protein
MTLREGQLREGQLYDCISQLCAIIEAEKLRTKQQL